MHCLWHFLLFLRKQILLGKKEKCEAAHVTIQAHFATYDCHIISQIFLPAREDGESLSLGKTTFFPN